MLASPAPPPPPRNRRVSPTIDGLLASGRPPRPPRSRRLLPPQDAAHRAQVSMHSGWCFHRYIHRGHRRRRSSSSQRSINVPRIVPGWRSSIRVALPIPRDAIIAIGATATTAHCARCRRRRHWLARRDHNAHSGHRRRLESCNALALFGAVGACRATIKGNVGCSVRGVILEHTTTKAGAVCRQVSVQGSAFWTRIGITPPVLPFQSGAVMATPALTVRAEYCGTRITCDPLL